MCWELISVGALVVGCFIIGMSIGMLVGYKDGYQDGYYKRWDPKHKKES